jgi:uncharacterized membrane protein (UPF0127 family)
MIRLAVLLLGLPLTLLAMPAIGQTGRPNTGLPTTRLTIGTHMVTAEVAATDSQRATGLMHRFSIAPDSGMLFVFEASQRRSFWMRNVSFPLSIAFIDASGTIVNIEDMAPHDDRSIWSASPVLYALEMRKGWFAQKGIGPGARVQGLPGKASE